MTIDLANDDANIALHASINELVFTCSHAALTGLCAAMRTAMHNGEVAFSEKEILCVADMAHMLGVRLACRHFAWVSGDASLSEFLDANADSKIEEQALLGIAKIGKKE